MYMGVRVLLAEGKDDPHVASALLNAYGTPVAVKERRNDRHTVLTLGADASTQVEVKVADGHEDVLNRLPTECKASDLERIGVIIDAEESLENTWEQVKSRFASVGIGNFPACPPLGWFGRSCVRRPGGRRLDHARQHAQGHVGGFDALSCTRRRPDSTPCSAVRRQHTGEHPTVPSMSLGEGAHPHLACPAKRTRQASGNCHRCAVFES